MKQSLYKSFALHVVVFLLLIVDLPFLSFGDRDMDIQVPIIVDLNDVKISEMTNLPPKAEFGAEDKQASSKKQKIEEKFTKEEKGNPEPETKKEEPKKSDLIEDEAPEDVAPIPPKQDFLVAPQPKKPQAPKEKKAPEPAKKPEQKKADNTKQAKEKGQPELANPLKSLLASVDNMEKNLGDSNSKATIKEGTVVNNMGIEGGVGGSYFSELSVSEIDAIAGRLRACWNLDPGAMGIKDMIIEIKAQLNRDGTVRDVRVMDMYRYNNDTHFRSVADSARRAVYICAPYSIFADKYADKFEKWETLKLRFNPLDGNVR